MPTTPMVIPLIIAGVMLGSLLVSEKQKISKRKLLGASLLGGLLNAANAFIVYTLFPPTTFSRFGGGNLAGGAFAGATFTGASTFQFRGGGAAGATSETSFLLLSFITGLLAVIVVVGAALLYVRYKSGKVEEQLGETKEELEEPKQEEQEEI